MFADRQQWKMPWTDADGGLGVREGLGLESAADSSIGLMFKFNKPGGPETVLTSGRAGYQMGRPETRDTLGDDA